MTIRANVWKWSSTLQVCYSQTYMLFGRAVNCGVKSSIMVCASCMSSLSPLLSPMYALSLQRLVVLSLGFLASPDEPVSSSPSCDLCLPSDALLLFFVLSDSGGKSSKSDGATYMRGRGKTCV